MSAASHHDDEGAKLGMWLFLVTELVLFGGLFLTYSWLRRLYPAEFHAGGAEMNITLGVVNTVVLLTSSLTVALGILAIQRGEKGKSMALLSASIGLGVIFLFIKGWEWAAKFHHGLYPRGAHLAKLPLGEQAFFGLYFTMTGLHGLHVLAGIAVFSFMLRMLARGELRQGRTIHLENAGLFWHLVDVVWILLLPLFYLAA